MCLIRRAVSLLMLSAPFFAAIPASAQYLGVTCGWQYSAQLSGPPSMPNQQNISLYNPDPTNPNATWDGWAEQMAQAGVDFVCPNLTGSQPNTGGSPTQMLPLLTALRNRGLTNQIKFAAFDDNAASWTAQWNMANGRGYGYAQKFDLADTNNWRYIYDYNYKIFYQTIPDENRFKINGRPLIMIWTGNTVTFLTNMQGNASQALLYVRQRCQTDFGFNPYIVLSQDFFSNDTTCNNPGVADASESWFVAGPSGPSYTLTTKNGVRIGVAVPQFQHPGQGGYLDPNHGLRFETGLSNTVGANALLTLCEGFTDYEEDAAMWRARNIDSAGGALGYAQTGYDYPNQRINILRKHSNWPFPPQLKFEAEGCDSYGGAAGGNGKVNYYRNGNIAIELTSDIGGGHDVGWLQTNQWLEWLEVPMQGGQVWLQARVATPNNNCQMHFVIDGTNHPAINIPNTGGFQSWATVECGPFTFAKNGRHTVRVVSDTGGFNLNHWQYRAAIPIGVNVRLQAKANDKWVSAATTTLNANVTVPTIPETFTIVEAGNGYSYGHVALRALANNQFVTADTNGVAPLSATATTISPTEIFQWTDNVDGTITLRALANSKLITATNSPATYPLVPNRIRNPGTSQNFAVSLVSSNTLSFVAQPIDTMVATSITAGNLGEVQVLALDANGNPVTNTTVNIAISSGAGALTGNTAITDGNGVAHFINLKIDRIGTKKLRASSSALVAATSSDFNITAGPASTLTIETQPGGTGSMLVAQNIPAGSSIQAHAVHRDALGNYVTNVAVAWSLTNITGGVVMGDLIPAGDSRSAVMTGHLVGTARIRAVAAFTNQSAIQTIVGGPAASLLVTQQPSPTAKVGLAFAQQPIVTQTDAFGNVSASSVTVTRTGGGYVNRNPNGVVGVPANGVTTFSGLYLTNLGVSSLTFTAGVATAQSANILVGIGNVERLAWTTQPGAATNGFPFGVSPVLRLVDAGGNITVSGLPAIKYVSVSIYSGNGTLLGTTLTNIGTAGANGAVTFSSLGINATGTFQLVAQDLGNGYNPTNVSAAANCRLWLDAADNSTLTLAGSTVSRWNDKSGRTNDATGSAALVTDSLLTATSPGRAQTVRFNGSHQMTMSLASLSNSPYTILVMEVGGSKPSGNSYFIGNNGGFSTGLTLGIGYQTASQFRWQQYADDLNFNASFTNIVPRQWTMNLSGSPSVTKRLFLNSAQVGTAGSGFLTGPFLVNGTVGYNNYLGNIAEILVYNTSLSTGDQTNLQEYLANKWLTGVSEAITQPFEVIAPVYHPSFQQITFDQAGGTISFAGANGPANSTFHLFSAPEVTTPSAAWVPVFTNTFDSSGAFQFTVPANPNVPAAFYRLVVP
jgi:hypothetical protein